MPWADIIIILLIAACAWIGYSIGFLGALKGFISNIVGLTLAWIFAPIAQAWLESKWGVETLLTSIVRGRIPNTVEAVVKAAAQTANTLQEFRDNLVVSMPPEIALYLQRTLSRAPMQSAFAPDQVVSAVTREIAQGILWAFLFFLIWLILSILTKSILGMIFIHGDGKTIAGMLDGLLGMTAMTVIVVVALIIFSGMAFPVMLLSNTGGSLSKVYPYLLDSWLINWMGSIYQLHFIPWVR